MVLNFVKNGLHFQFFHLRQIRYSPRYVIKLYVFIFPLDSFRAFAIQFEHLPFKMCFTTDILIYDFTNCYSAWVLEDQIWPYVDYHDKYKSPPRQSRTFLDAVETADELVKHLPAEKVRMPTVVWS